MHSYYSGDGLGFQHLGQDTPAPPNDALAPNTTGSGSPGVGLFGRLAAIGGTLSMPALAYHGYKRNDSVGWAFVWGFFGSMVWPVMVPVALAQGFAKPKRGVRRNPRRRRTTRRRRTSRRAR